MRASTTLSALMVLATIGRHLVSPLPLSIILTNGVVAAAFLMTPLLARRRCSPAVVAAPIGIGLTVCLLNGGMLAGGVNAPVIALVPLLPVMGFCFGGRRLGMAALTVCVVLLAGLVFGERLGWTAPLLDQSNLGVQRAVTMVAIALAAYAIGATYEASRRMSEQRVIEAWRLASLGTMAAGIAHEINNPLAVVAGFASHIEGMARSGTIDAAAIETLAKRISKATFRIANIIAILRRYANDESAEPMTPVSLAAIVSDTCGLCRERFKNAGVDLRIGEIPEAATFMGRPSQISDVILSLLQNAFDATDQAADRWIALACVISGSVVEVSVTDSGPGVAEAEQAKIFTPFFTTKDVGKGMGVGLSLSASVMRQHGGEILLDRGSDHTKFILRFRKIAAQGAPA